MRLLQVGDPLALAVPEALQLALAQEPRPLHLGQCGQRLPDGAVRTGQQRAMPVGEHQELAEVSLRLGPAANPEKVDDLNEETGPSTARLANGAHQLRQAGDEAVMADPEQRPTRDVADAGGLDHQGTRLAAREALVPGEDLRGDESILGRPPGHHRRHPGPLRQVESALAQRTEPPRPGRLVGGGGMRGWDGMLDEGDGVPHGAKLSYRLLGIGYRLSVIRGAPLGSANLPGHL